MPTDTPPTKPKTPHRERPKLVGYTFKEAALIERAAKKVGVKGIPFIRESSLSKARATLGLKSEGG